MLEGINLNSFRLIMLDAKFKECEICLPNSGSVSYKASLLGVIQYGIIEYRPAHRRTEDELEVQLAHLGDLLACSTYGPERSWISTE